MRGSAATEPVTRIEHEFYTNPFTGSSAHEYRIFDRHWRLIGRGEEQTAEAARLEAEKLNAHLVASGWAAR